MTNKNNIQIRYAVNGAPQFVTSESPERIHREITELRHRGINPCFQVYIEGNGLNIALITPSCAPGFGGRAPTSDEKKILDRWNARCLNTNAFLPSDAAQFVKDVMQHLN
jgi:hypothetical protein